MPTWNKEYYKSLEDKFETINTGLENKIENVVSGRVAPSINDITIGSGRKFDCAILFFDIRGFTNRTSSSDMSKLKETLIMLDCVIPMVMQIIHDFGGYVEKNTGDGVMGIIGLEDEKETATKNALNASLVIFSCLKNIINPYLVSKNIEKVDARIGIDYGDVIISRIGLPNGTSQYDRNFLTAVGPTANIASKIQNQALTNKIYVGNNIYNYAPEDWKKFFKDQTLEDWNWIYVYSGEKYKVFDFDAFYNKPK